MASYADDYARHTDMLMYPELYPLPEDPTDIAYIQEGFRRREADLKRGPERYVIGKKKIAYNKDILRKWCVYFEEDCINLPEYVIAKDVKTQIFSEIDKQKSLLTLLAFILIIGYIPLLMLSLRLSILLMSKMFLFVLLPFITAVGIPIIVYQFIKWKV